MAISARQAELFAGESWTVLYQAFKSINFNATDPVSINQALQSYIQINYPEEFNDWISSSEFVALIDLLSWLAGTLAFKTDLDSRENFIDTAEARESILRLARFLSYNPSRCAAATGMVKIVSVFTNDDVYDSFGVNQANTTINWNDPTNTNWFEQFLAVLNNAFVVTNPFGIPLKSGTVDSIATQLYRVNGLASASLLGFNSTVSGTSMDFEICNADLTTASDGSVISEKTPNPANAFQMIYQNDGQGNASANTGFFLLFKQGTTQTQLFNISVPVENQLLDINTANINQTDVWVETVDDSGAVTITWTPVQNAAGSVASNNITYNNIDAANRNIFSVITRDNDQVTIRFSDGLFGNAPSGNILVTYRVSNGLVYQIKPLEIDTINLSLLYTNQYGVQKTLVLTFSLYQSVANAAASETINEIRSRAPQVYATQNRMVSGEDYNVFPLSSNVAAKINAVNRVYSGQSRYIDLGDPTGTFQDLSLFGDDGILFRDPSDTYLEVPISLNKTADEIVNDYLLPAISQYTTSNIIRDVLMQNVLNGGIVSQTNTWTTSNANLFQTTGWFSNTDNLVQPGALISFNIAGRSTWVAVTDVQGAITSVPPQNTAGPVTLSKEVPTGSTVMGILPSATVQINSTVLSTITNNLRLNLSFSLYYDYYNVGSTSGPTWGLTAQPQNDFGDPEPALGDPSSVVSPTQLLMANVSYVSGVWRINVRGLRYVFESISSVEFFDNGDRGLSQLTGEAVVDTIDVLRINQNLNDIAGHALPTNYNLSINRLWSYPDGTPEPRRCTVLFSDGNGDGYPDLPDTFYKLIAFGFGYQVTANVSSGATVLPLATINSINVQQGVIGAGIAPGTRVTAITGSTITLSHPTIANIPSGEFVIIAWPNHITTYLFWSNAANPPYDEPLYTVIVYQTDTLLNAATPAIGTVGFLLTSSVSYLFDETFWVYNGTSWEQDTSGTYRMERGRGPNVAAEWVTPSGTPVPLADPIYFHWRHYAPSDHRIDPAQTNIVDIFVLTYAYDTAVRQWISSGANAETIPTPPTELELRLTPELTALETFKMFSDQIVWRPVSYKYLFGNGADPELRAQFKVVRVPNASVSDGEIQTQIITAINTYFAVANWGFGETFYFTELAAYIHQQLVGLIGSVVLVPLASDAAFGDGFEVACRSDEIFVSTAQVTDIILIPSNTAVNLRIRAT